jgi:hypothetical protein
MKEVDKNVNQAARTSSVSWSRVFGVPKVLDNVVLDNIEANLLHTCQEETHAFLRAIPYKPQLTMTPDRFRNARKGVCMSGLDGVHHEER